MHRLSVHTRQMHSLGKGWGSLKVIGVFAALLVVPRVGLAQECETDADCGHGFQCIHDSAGTSSVTGAGGSSMPECGDGICEGGSEDIDSCPQDCDTIQYCAPGECSSDSDCAEGYECGPEVGSNSAVTSVGGSGGSVCGDGICSFDESNASCPEDCRVYRLCQVKQVICMGDEDCPDGFYCYREGVDAGSSGSSNVEGSSGSTDTADSSNGSDGTDGDERATTSGGERIVFVAGVCLPESSDATTTQGNSSTDGGQAASGSGGSGTDGGGGAASDGNALNASATGSGESSGSDSGGSSSGGASGDGSGGAGSGDGGGSDDEGGCACVVA